MTEKESLQVIVGRQLGSVEFVQDYVQLRFDGPCLTAFTHPTVEVQGRTLQWKDPGYRDELCNRIATKVCQADVIADDKAVVRFEDGSEINISLKKADYVGPEAVKFDHREIWWVL